jgi:hypothetical protein
MNIPECNLPDHDHSITEWLLGEWSIRYTSLGDLSNGPVWHYVYNVNAIGRFFRDLGVKKIGKVRLNY